MNKKETLKVKLDRKERFTEQKITVRCKEEGVRLKWLKEADKLRDARKRGKHFKEKECKFIYQNSNRLSTQKLLITVSFDSSSPAAVLPPTFFKAQPLLPILSPSEHFCL